MEFQPVDLKDILGITFGMMVVLIPIIGATIRFAARPLVDSLIRAGVIGNAQAQAAALADGAPRRDLELLSRRVLELEQEVARLKGLGGPRAVQAVDEGPEAVRLAEPQRLR